MRLVIQRVKEASVKIVSESKICGEIGSGLLVLIGVGKGDTTANSDQLAEKLIKLRIMSDDKGKMNLSVKDKNSEILVISQFTLYANTSGGNRPSFIDAAEPDTARQIYNSFVAKLKNSGLNIQTGKFGEYMEISAKLDGPVTILT